MSDFSLSCVDLLRIAHKITVKKITVDSLLQQHDSDSLEAHFIHAYLTHHRINIGTSPILAAYFSTFNPDPSLLAIVHTFPLSAIEELDNQLELIIPTQDRQLNGAYFTPRYISAFIIGQLSPQYTERCLDPSCGSGAFLMQLTDYYVHTFKKSVRNTLRENIFGADILPYNIRRARLLLTVYGLQQGEIIEEQDINLTCHDSLTATWPDTFDVIVGNPPYVRFQDLDEPSRNRLARHWQTTAGGTFNLYFAFFELGYKLLTPSGRLGYITPNNYFTSLAGESLRQFFGQRQCVYRILDFSHKKVFDAQTYTAITLLNKRRNPLIDYDRINATQQPAGFLQQTEGSSNVVADLNPKKWRLLKTDEQDIIRRLETVGTSIGKLFDICVGIATLKDDLYFLDGTRNIAGDYLKITNKGTFSIEAELTRAVFKISDFKTQADVDQNKRRIITPYQWTDGVATVIGETEFARKFPKAYHYLLAYRDELASRDKGKVAYSPFYAWGRTQGLTRTGKKLVTPTFSQLPRFLTVADESAFFTNGYGIFFREQSGRLNLFDNPPNLLAHESNRDVVQKILNSSLMAYYVAKTSVSIEGGYPCYQKNFIEKFSIPAFIQAEVEQLRQCRTGIDADDFLTEKYGLVLGQAKPLLVNSQ
jgi:adenine-specific DNA-methyltransferase